MPPRHEDESQEITLARIDERTENILQRMDTFVTRDEFAPVRMLAFGFAGLVLLGFIGALISAVMK